MKVLKIELIQKNANYRVPETINNRMTYPLPPLSTIIGSIHNCCNWTDYHEMDIGIIGKYDSITTDFKRINYIDHVRTDREMFVKTADNIYNNFSVKKICRSIGGNGGDFKNEDKTIYFDKKELNKYFNLKTEYDNLDNQKKEINKTLKGIKKNKTLAKKNKDFNQFNILEELENNLNIEKENVQEKMNELNNEINQYYLLHNEVCHYEVLNNVELILYISSTEKNLKEIQENLYNLTSIGRSEDFINILSSKIVELKEDINKIYRNKSGYNSYIDIDLIKNDQIFLNDTSQTENINGTVYRIQKDYKIENGKRIFNKKKVCYISNYEVETSCSNVYIDDTDKNNIFVVNLL